MSEIAPAAPESAAPAAAPAQPSGYWLEGADAETQAWAQQWGHESPMHVVKALRGMERLKGAAANELVRIPKAEDAEAMAKLWTQLGRPEKPDGYELPERPPTEGMIDLRPALLPLAHEAGLTQRQVQMLEPALTKVLGELGAQEQEKLEAQRVGDEQALKREWGQAYEQNLEVADRGAEALGLEQAEVQALARSLGPGKAIRILHRIGKGLGEHTFVDGEGRPGGFAFTPASAQAEIARLKTDEKFQAALADRSHPGYRDAKARERQLYEAAYGNEPRG
jgi:hypothetical protein